MRSVFTPPPAPPFAVSTHADLRALERFSLAGGHVLTYLNERQVVWLDELGPDNTRYALAYSAAANAYLVLAVSSTSVLKTVLTLEMYEGTRRVIGVGQLQLARFQASRGLPVQSAAPTALDAQTEEVARRRSLELDESIPLADKLELWTDQPPSGFWLRFGALHDRAQSVRDLGHISANALTELGLTVPVEPKVAPPFLAADWVERMPFLARTVLTYNSIQAWLLRRLCEQADIIDTVDGFHAELGHGWRGHHGVCRALARIDVTAQVREVLGLSASSTVYEEPQRLAA